MMISCIVMSLNYVGFSSSSNKLVENGSRGFYLPLSAAQKHFLFLQISKMESRIKS